MHPAAPEHNQAADDFFFWVHYATGLLWLNGRDKEVITALRELIPLPPTPSAPVHRGRQSDS